MAKMTPEEFALKQKAWLARQNPVTKRQAKEQLIRMGLYDTVVAALSAIQDPTEKAIANNYWSEATEFQRDNPVLVNLSKNVLQLTDEQIDDLFIAAKEL